MNKSTSCVQGRETNFQTKRAPLKPFRYKIKRIEINKKSFIPPVPETYATVDNLFEEDYLIKEMDIVTKKAHIRKKSKVIQGYPSISQDIQLAQMDFKKEPIKTMISVKSYESLILTKQASLLKSNTRVMF